MTCAAIYARVSTADGTQDPENQLTELRRFAASHGWEIVGEYIDHDSGGKADRTQFNAMMSAASERTFDVLVVWALDRLTREGVAETFQYIKRLAASGVQFVSFKEEHFRSTGPAGELMIAVAAWIAKYERLRISERVRAGLNRARTQGRNLALKGVPEPDGFGTEEATAEACRIASNSATRIVSQLGDSIGRKERTRVLTAFRRTLIPPKPRGRKREARITAALKDWRAGVRGVHLYRAHIPRWAKHNRYRQRAEEKALRDAIGNRERRERRTHRNERATLEQVAK